MVDFSELKRTTKIEDVALRLNLEGKAQGVQWRGACPHCKSGGPRALAINTDKGSFYCFSASTGGDCIGLAAHVLGLGNKEAADWIAGPQSPKREKPSSSPQPRNEERTKGFDAEAYIAKLDPAHEAVELLGLDADTARALSIGYCSQGILRGTVAFPIRLDDGTISGFVGITEARLPNRWNLERRIVQFPQAKKSA